MHLGREGPQPLSPIPLLHTATARLLLRSLRTEEMEVLNALSVECDSRSGAALCALNAEASRIRDRLFSLRDSRPAQAVLLRLVSDSGLCIIDARLRCPNCEVGLTLTHVLCECPAVGRPRQEAADHCDVDAPTAIRNYAATADLLPTFCRAGHLEIRALLDQAAAAQRLLFSAGPGGEPVLAP